MLYTAPEPVALIAYRGAVQGEVLRQTVMIQEGTYGFAVSALEVAFYHTHLQRRQKCLSWERGGDGRNHPCAQNNPGKRKDLGQVSMNFFRALGENYMRMLKNQWRTQLAGSQQAHYAPLLFYDPVEHTDLTYWIPCSQLSHDGIAAFLNLSGDVRCGCSFSRMCCTRHRDPNTSASCPGQRHCGCGNLWPLQPTNLLSAKYLFFNNQDKAWWQGDIKPAGILACCLPS